MKQKGVVEREKKWRIRPRQKTSVDSDSSSPHSLRRSLDTPAGTRQAGADSLASLLLPDALFLLMFALLLPLVGEFMRVRENSRYFVRSQEINVYDHDDNVHFRNWARIILQLFGSSFGLWLLDRYD